MTNHFWKISFHYHYLESQKTGGSHPCRLSKGPYIKTMTKTDCYKWCLWRVCRTWFTLMRLFYGTLCPTKRINTIKKFSTLLYAISMLCLNIQNSGAKYVDNKMPRQFLKFLMCLQYVNKKLLTTLQEPLYIMLAMVLAYLSIFPRVMFWFFNSWDYLFHLNYIVYL